MTISFDNAHVKMEGEIRQALIKHGDLDRDEDLVKELLDKAVAVVRSLQSYTQELARIREGKLAQELFSAQRSLNEVARVCGLPNGMNLVTAVPKLASKVVVDLGWTQEQNGHLAQLVNATAGERDQARADLTAVQGELAQAREEHEAEVTKLRTDLEALAKVAYPAPTDPDDRVVQPSDLPALTFPTPPS